jgi:lipid II:glycine glycyltransferase (peptidoglycan interpeptide bridge formation enzyme)
MLFLIHGQVASYHMGWASEEGRTLNAHNALLWKAMAYLKAEGVSRLDLGGVNTHDLPGISRFKLGAGGQVVTLAGTYF